MAVPPSTDTIDPTSGTRTRTFPCGCCDPLCQKINGIPRYLWISPYERLLPPGDPFYGVISHGTSISNLHTEMPHTFEFFYDEAKDGWWGEFDVRLTDYHYDCPIPVVDPETIEETTCDFLLCKVEVWLPNYGPYAGIVMMRQTNYTNTQLVYDPNPCGGGDYFLDAACISQVGHWYIWGQPSGGPTYYPGPNMTDDCAYRGTCDLYSLNWEAEYNFYALGPPFTGYFVGGFYIQWSYSSTVCFEPVWDYFLSPPYPAAPVAATDTYDGSLIGFGMWLDWVSPRMSSDQMNMVVRAASDLCVTPDTFNFTGCGTDFEPTNGPEPTATPEKLRPQIVLTPRQIMQPRKSGCCGDKDKKPLVVRPTRKF